jgi:hypothetical protein
MSRLRRHPSRPRHPGHTKQLLQSRGRFTFNTRVSRRTRSRLLQSPMGTSLTLRFTLSFRAGFPSRRKSDAGQEQASTLSLIATRVRNLSPPRVSLHSLTAHMATRCMIESHKRLQSLLRLHAWSGMRVELERYREILPARCEDLQASLGRWGSAQSRGRLVRRMSLC